jgi:type I restriction enzyme S subunit
MSKQAKLDAFMKENISKNIEEDGEVIQGPYDLPEGWKWVKLKDIVIRVQYGLSKTMNSEKIGLPIIRMNNLTYDGFLDLSDLKYVNIENEIANKYMLEKGDILFNRTNSRDLVGKTTVFNQDGKFVFASYLIRVIVDRNKAIPEYISMYLNSRRVKEIFFRIARPAVQMANINAKELCSIEIPLPPLEEQKRIVSRLEQLINRAEEAKRLRKLAKEEAEKIMQAALNKVFSKAEEEGWEWVKLGEISKISAGGTPKRSIKEYWNGDIPWVKISDIPEDGLVLDTEEKITEEGLTNSSAKIFPRGTILFSIFATIAKVGILGIDAATNQAIAGIQIKDVQIIDQKYLFYCLKSFGFSLLTVGRGMAQRNINQTILRSLKIPFPSLEEQKRIVTYLDKISKTVEYLKRFQQKTNEELEKLVPSILDKAFKGGL